MQDVRRKKVFFFHNLKAAGTSVGQFLEQCSNVHYASPVIENSQRDHERLGGQYGRFRGFQFFAGHYGYDIFSAVNDGHCAITNLRDPATRLLSLYNYYRLQVTVRQCHTQRAGSGSPQRRGSAFATERLRFQG